MAREEAGEAGVEEAFLEEEVVEEVITMGEEAVEEEEPTLGRIPATPTT